MDRRDTARLFRQRLDAGMTRAGLNRSATAARAGIDRSTLSQLLSPDTGRLPRADTAASLAAALRVSLDWLLGLGQEDQLDADILHESLEITPSPAALADDGLARWHREAAGYKIRYVPATLPDLFKTDAVIAHEFRDFAARTTDRAKTASHDRLAYSRLPETDMEICLPVQRINGFTRGEGLWTDLPAAARAEQVETMIRLTDELYPTLRMYLFDGLTHFSAPYTIFGALRAAVYMGQMYFVLNTTEHIQGLTRHFDDLIRAAVVQANEAAGFLRHLRQEVR